MHHFSSPVTIRYKTLLMTRNALMSSKQAGGDGKSLKLVVFVENVWHTSTQTSTQLLQFTSSSGDDDCVMRTSHFLCQFSRGLRQVYADGIVQLLFIQLNRCDRTWIIFECKVTLNKTQNPLLCSLLSPKAPSPYTVQMSRGAFASFNPCWRKQMSWMLISVNLALHR